MMVYITQPHYQENPLFASILLCRAEENCNSIYDTLHPNPQPTHVILKQHSAQYSGTKQSNYLTEYFKGRTKKKIFAQLNTQT